MVSPQVALDRGKTPDYFNKGGNDVKTTIRKTILVLIDAFFINLAVFASLMLRFDGNIPDQYINAFMFLIPVFTIVTLSCLAAFKLYCRLWEYASITELRTIVTSVSCSMLIIIALIHFLNLNELPRSVYIYSWLTIIVFVGGTRLSWRLLRDLFLQAHKQQELYRVLIVGAGDAGAILAREFRHNPALKRRTIAFVDDDPDKHKMILNGIPVLGTRQQIPTLVNDHNIHEIIIAMPSVNGKVIREISELAQNTPAQVRILPGLFLNRRHNLYRNVRKLQMEDLLKRESVKIDFDEIAGYIKGKNVLVTGAGGSIGSELCRQIFDQSPAKIILLDNCENNLFDIEMELNDKHLSTEIYPELVDIRTPEKLKAVFRKYRPQVVFHAAAYKHVPMMERHPGEALNNNVIGSRNVAECADACNVETFIYISTDKAVNPTSVMGASKRIAELIIKDLDRNSKTKFAIVRFGNVLGSRGSVIPTFLKQIEKGGPVTVTHPDMVRYFMTIPEAVQLVIQAGAMAKGGEIFVLDMGDPVKIDDLARDLIKLSGYQPDKDIEIVYSGIRPGEKLFEELFTDKEGLLSSKHERIYISNKDLDANYLDISKSVKLLISKPVRERNEVLRIILDIVPEYQGKYQVIAGKEAKESQGVG